MMRWFSAALVAFACVGLFGLVGCTGDNKGGDKMKSDDKMKKDDKMKSDDKMKKDDK